MGDILYSYACNEEGKLVNIAEVDKNHHGKFTCLNCGQPMSPVLGDKREHHFRHTAGNSCNGETYLHKLGKKIIKIRFDQSQSFLIKYRVRQEAHTEAMHCWKCA